jgi:hypothetical protein
MDNMVLAMEETVKPFLQNNNLHHKYMKLKNEYTIPSMNQSGFATQLSVAKDYTSPMHVDKDYMYTVLTCYCEQRGTEGKIIYNFCFPDYDIVVPMMSGTMIVFDPRIVHCATNPMYEGSYIMSCYVSKKTVDTVVALKEREILDGHCKR